MKTRNGFVSNSSTSSFVVVIKKEHHDKVMQEIHPYIKACIDALGCSVKKFNGDEVVSFGTLTTQGGSQWEYIDVEFDGDMGELDAEEAKYEASDTYIAKARELFGKDSVLTSDLDG
jgi:hypothetical protein